MSVKIFYKSKPQKNSVLDALKTARKLRLQAKIESEKIINEAVRDSQKIKQECLNEFRKRAEVEHAIESQKMRQTLLSKHKQSIIEIACHIAKELIETELQTDPTCILPRVHRALNNISTQEQVTLEVSEENFEMVSREMFGLLTVTSNSNLSTLDFILRTSTGTIEGLIGDQLEIIKRKLQDKAESIFEEDKNSNSQEQRNEVERNEAQRNAA